MFFATENFIVKIIDKTNMIFIINKITLVLCMGKNIIIFAYMKENEIKRTPLEEFFYGCMSIGLILPWLDKERRIITNQMVRSRVGNILVYDIKISITNLITNNIFEPFSIKVDFLKLEGLDTKTSICNSTSLAIDYLQKNLPISDEYCINWDVQRFSIGGDAIVSFLNASKIFMREDSLSLNHRSMGFFDEYIFKNLISDDGLHYVISNDKGKLGYLERIKDGVEFRIREIESMSTHPLNNHCTIVEGIEGVTKLNSVDLSAALFLKEFKVIGLLSGVDLDHTLIEFKKTYKSSHLTLNLELPNDMENYKLVDGDILTEKVSNIEVAVFDDANVCTLVDFDLPKKDEVIDSIPKEFTNKEKFDAIMRYFLEKGIIDKMVRNEVLVSIKCNVLLGEDVFTECGISLVAPNAFKFVYKSGDGFGEVLYRVEELFSAMNRDTFHINKLTPQPGNKFYVIEVLDQDYF